MHETLQQYRERTAFMEDSLPRSGGLRTSAGLTQKIAPDGSFLPFFGDTMIFALDAPLCQWLTDVQAALYDACGACLARRIPPETFHITLHDLLNQPERMPEGVSQTRPAALEALSWLRQNQPPTVRVRSRCMFSMVGASVVMGFEPAEEADCAALMALHERFQAIVPLSYPLTLHATLAYYRPGAYDEDALQRLRDAMWRIGRAPRVWPLHLDALHYATFDSMARYALEG
ncbi:MAG: hypothetical protein ACI4O7_02240 [Aristaeellaceae bacterium]